VLIKLTTTTDWGKMVNRNGKKEKKKKRKNSKEIIEQVKI